MKKPFALTICLLLAGCTDADWDHVMNYGGLAEPDAAQVAAPPPQESVAVPAAIAGPGGEPANGEFCRAVAAQDATGNDFDKQTQARVYARSYAQCLTIYTR